MGLTGWDKHWQALGLGADELRVYEALLDVPEPASRTALAQSLGLTVRRVTTALDQLAEHSFTHPAGGVAGLPATVAPSTALRSLIHLCQAELLHGSAELEELTGCVDRIAAQLLSSANTPRATGIETVRGGAAIAAPGGFAAGVGERGGGASGPPALRGQSGGWDARAARRGRTRQARGTGARRGGP
ncbi:hypothetical protein [Streptomyces sp. NPDC057287]|uniref:hypothetical protein n=1 Tax=Streptomyces sp. NPDC057287 TaxID=3346086 RepID=UPI0036391C56